MNPNLPTPPVHTAHIRTPNTQPPARALTLCARVGYYTAAVLLQPVSWSICACPPAPLPAPPPAPAHRPRAIPHASGTRSSAACATRRSHATPSARLRHTLGMQRRVPRGGHESHGSHAHPAAPLFRFTTVKLSGVLQ